MLPSLHPLSTNRNIPKLILLSMVMLSVAACRLSDPELRNAHTDSPYYYADDWLRSDTVEACHAGTAAEQAEWEKLDACRASDHASKHVLAMGTTIPRVDPFRSSGDGSMAQATPFP
jgi:hypothetical protein